MLRALCSAAISIALAGLACTSANDEPAPAKPAPDKAESLPPKPPPPIGSVAPEPAFEAVKFSDRVMGTVVDVTLWTDDKAGARKAADAVFAEFTRVDALMSSWLPDSAVARINKAAGSRSIVVGDELMTLIGAALVAGKESEGAFDITVGAFRGLWKFDQDVDGSIPSKNDVAQRAKLVNYQEVEVSPKARSVKLARKGMRITLGGIAKGHAVDRSVAILRAQGFEDFILQAGGDLFVSGDRGTRKWRVGIRDPRGDRDESFAVAEISNRTFSTSGDYERFVIKDGVRYHHLLDPATGRPATRSRSVTVLAPDALTADIWSTALFVLGHDKGIKIVEARKEIDAVFVDSDNHVHISSGLQGTLRMLKEPTPGI